MGHLARQSLPTGHASDLDQAFLGLLELGRHVIERLHRRSDFARAFFWDASSQVARGHAFQSLRQLPNRTGDARGQKYQSC